MNNADSCAGCRQCGAVPLGRFSGDIHRRMLSQGFPWDAVQMPLNVLDAHFASFEREIVPLCQEQGIAVIGMKSNAGGHLNDTNMGITPEEALRYAMSLPVATVIFGMDSLEVLRKNIAVAEGYVPLSQDERAVLLARSAPHAEGAVAEPFKSTRGFEGTEGRVANGYPLKA
jgi:aryl-alcohol dehydrogenase-like predicted oxidoreductase